MTAHTPGKVSALASPRNSHKNFPLPALLTGEFVLPGLVERRLAREPFGSTSALSGDCLLFFSIFTPFSLYALRGKTNLPVSR